MLNEFTPATESEVIKLVKSKGSKSCSLDPMPTWLLKDCITDLAAPLTSIINDSMATGTFPSQLKSALVTPILKKPSLDQEVLKNYRPVSNLPYVSKALESIVAARFVTHCNNNNLMNYHQSAYRSFHSTETALLKVQNDLLQAVDQHGAAILVLLDLSAAFDTIDHEMLLTTLHDHFGVTGTVKAWFASYLQNRHQSVSVPGATSTAKELSYGVPQGSVLGPILFTAYTKPLSAEISAQDLDHHLYADDSQLWIAFNPRSVAATGHATVWITQCISHIKNWMDSHFLKMNSNKTEVMVISTPQAHRSLNLDSITLQIEGEVVEPNSHACNLGVTMDKTLSMETHINTICKKAHYQLHNIQRIRKYLNENAARTIVQALVTSRLDYCNSLLIGLPACLIRKLQLVQNTAARVIARSRKYDHITPIMIHLHWLPIEQRIQFKVALLTYKALNDLAPQYLSNMLMASTSRALRSSSQRKLMEPSFRLSTFGGRSFMCAAPRLWNSLPTNLKNCTSVTMFRNKLKTYLFKEAYPDC